MPEKNRFPAVLVANTIKANSGRLHIEENYVPVTPTGILIHGTHESVVKVASFTETAGALTKSACSGNIGNSTTTAVLDRQPISIQAGAVRENPESGPDADAIRTDGIAYTLEARAEVQAVAFMPARTLAADGEVDSRYAEREVCDALHTGSGHGNKAPLLAFTCKDYGADAGDLSPTLRGMGHDASHANAGGQVAIAFKPSHFTRGKDGAPSETYPPLSADADKGDQEAVVLVHAYRTSSNGSVFDEGDLIAPLTTQTDPCTNVVAYAVRTAQTSANGIGVAEGVSHTLDGANGQAVCFESRFTRNGRGAPDTVVPPLKAQSGETGKGDAAPPVAQPGMAVRRLTPRECERLQGFPDDWTQVPYRGKPAADGPRYKAIGNSMAVPCMAWIGERLQRFTDPDWTKP
jgi:C-5 cytosine-specific DNA methylase